jgi:hypothetical protein
MTDEEKTLAKEKDGFMKTGIVAVTANCLAHNKANQTMEDIVRSAVRATHAMWIELQNFREDEKQ